MRYVLIASVAAVCFCALVNCQSNETTTTTRKPTTGTPTTGTPTTGKPTESTTSPPMTTTPMPLPPKAKDAPVMNYTIVTKDEKTKKDIICLMATFSTKIELTYNNTKEMVTGYVSLSNTSFVNNKSKCGDDEIVLSITINDVPSNVLTMTVGKKDNKYFVKKVDLVLNESSIASSIPLAPRQPLISASMDNVTVFDAPLGKSYICKANVDMDMHSSDPEFKIKMDVNNVRFDAFRKEEGNSWREGQLCSQDEEFSDIIPIAVGAALAALVIIVLIAYFIGRRRSRRLAYQSV